MINSKPTLTIELIEELERRDLENNSKDPEGSLKIKEQSSVNKDKKPS